jgi:carboxylesterase type B
MRATYFLATTFSVATLSPQVAYANTDDGVQIRQNRWTVGQVVNTTSGPVQGHASVNATSVSEYLGIPFAVPPVGNLRFQPPVRFNGTKALNGTDFGFACMQVGLGAASSAAGSPTMGSSSQASMIPLAPAAAALLASFTQMSPPNEDCLTLNVWTKPQVGEAKKAVMVRGLGSAKSMLDLANYYIGLDPWWRIHIW